MVFGWTLTEQRGKKNKIILIDTEKAFDRIQHPFMINHSTN